MVNFYILKNNITARAARLRKDISAAISKQLSAPWVPSFCHVDGIRWYEDGSFSKEGGGCSDFFSEPLQTTNTPHTCTPQGMSISQLFSKGGNCFLCIILICNPPRIVSEWREYCVHFLPSVTDQVSAANRLIPSLITLNSRGILSPYQQQPALKADEQKRARSELLRAEFEKNSVQSVQHSFSETRSKLASRFALSERLQFMPVSLFALFSKSFGDQVFC